MLPAEITFPTPTLIRKAPVKIYLHLVGHNMSQGPPQFVKELRESCFC